mgnify:CR=1 FL=1
MWIVLPLPAKRAGGDMLPERGSGGTVAEDHAQALVEAVGGFEGEVVGHTSPFFTGSLMCPALIALSAILAALR